MPEISNVHTSQLLNADINKLSELSVRYITDSINNMNRLIEDLPLLPPMLQTRIQEMLSSIQGLTRLSVEEG